MVCVRCFFSLFLLLYSVIASDSCKKIHLYHTLSNYDVNKISLSIKASTNKKLGEDFRAKSELSESIEEYKAVTQNEDVKLGIAELIQKYGYPVEEHSVTNEDGYVLKVHRIPRRGKVVYLMHGILGSSDDWILAGPNSALAYLLADQGYDVWMGNARGNKHSRKHIILNPECKEFWDFTFDAIGRDDVPSMVDYILQETGQSDLAYIGFSQGTTAFFVMCSELPEYNEKINFMVSLSPMAWMSEVESPLLRVLSESNTVDYQLLKLFGPYKYAPSNMATKALSAVLCGADELSRLICDNFAFMLSGFEKAQMNISNLPVIFGHFPSGCATKQLIHYAQLVDSCQFRNYDHEGSTTNIDIYGFTNAPDYFVEIISVPIAMFYSDNDWLSSIVDVEILKSKLQNVVDYHFVEKYSHFDYIWGINVKDQVNDRVLELLENFL